MNRPIHLLFDVMSTLVYDPFMLDLPAFLGMSFEELLASKHPTAWMEFERGEIDEATYLDKFFADGRSYDSEGMKQMFQANYRLLDGTESLLTELAHAGADLHLFSNYPHWYHVIEDKLSLSRLAPWSFVSCDIGIRKPSKEVFQHVFQQLQAKPSDCVLIDDTRENCNSATALGAHAIHYQDDDGLRRSLSELGWS